MNRRHVSEFIANFVFRRWDGLFNERESRGNIGMSELLFTHFLN